MATTEERSPQPTSPDAASPPADVLELAIAADRVELAKLRAALREWLPADGPDGFLVDDLLLVTSEMAGLGVEHGDPGHPIAVRVRYTHSIVVVEVSCHVADPSHAAIFDAFGTDRVGYEMTIIENLADRLITEPGPHRITMRSSFNVPPLK